MIDDLYIALKQEVPSPYVVILAALSGCRKHQGGRNECNEAEV
ncbi:hypothetical protein [Mesorhizobium sp.]|nr:hypothetical protein [Mesorhizobium sp.]